MNFELHTPGWFLQNTISFYNSNNRGINENGTCIYISKDGKRCAIGKYLNIDESFDTIGSAKYICQSYPEVVPDWMLAMSYDFLNYIQQLHDFEENWDEKGLTDKGKYQVEVICKKFNIPFDQLIFNN